MPEDPSIPAGSSSGFSGEAETRDAESPDAAQQAVSQQLDKGVRGRDDTLQPVIGLGGSAGSLKALRTFFSHMATDSGLAFVVIVHLSPDHESRMATLLQGFTSMPVVQVSDTVKVEANRVYVIPPAKHLSLADGQLRLSELLPERGRRVAVDLFFRTLADTHGAQATAIVLSGADADGAIGLKRVKERGGLTIAQDPEEAEHNGMPRAAIATGMVDWVLRAAEMPAQLLKYYRNEPRLFLPAEEPPERLQVESSDAEVALRETLVFLRVRTGHNFSDYKRATILRRIARLMQFNGIQELPSYLAFVRSHPGEVGALVQDLLISVTNFFRDREAFQALETELSQLFRDKKATDQVRAWVVGSATGEEAYSVAILLAEYASKLRAPPSLQVFATDLDKNAIRIGREGLYPDTIEADVSEERLRRFFSREHGRYQVNRTLRESVLFAHHNVLKDSPFSHLDLISCRNLLIYLNQQAQGRVLDLFHFALESEGMLFLGSSESVDDARPFFKILDKKHRLYKRLPAHRQAVPLLTGPTTLGQEIGSASHLQAATTVAMPFGQGVGSLGRERGLSLGELHFKLLAGFAPGSVLIDKDDNVVHLSERAKRYLQLGGGEATLNLFRVVHPMLRVELRAAIFRARQTGSLVKMAGLPVELDDVRHAVDLYVRPAPEPASDLMLVLFEEHAVVSTGEVAEAQPAEPLIRQLEEELDQLKINSRAMVEEYEASLEELKSSNEELQAINEELRSATEEVETNREELQSINEELSTVNQELKSKVEELAKTNSDLQNLMASTDIATVFLDRQLRIQRYTPAAVKLFSLIPTDIGRPLSDLSHRLENNFIVADAERVLERLAPVERERRSRDGQWFIVRLLPYRTPEDQISGVVLTFVDITERKAAEDDRMRLHAAIAAAQGHLRLIFENAREYAIFSLDRERRVTSWNVGAERLLGFSESEISGQPYDVIFTPEERSTGAPEKLVLQALAEGHASDESWHQRKDGSRFWGSGVIMAMRDARGEVVGLVKILRDETDARNAREALVRALEDTERKQAEAEAANSTKDRFLAVLSHELRTPLTPVLLSLSTLDLERGLSETAQESLKSLRRNVETEIRLIDDLLDVNRIVHGKLESKALPVDLHACIRLALDVCARDLREKNLKLTVSLEAVLHHVLGDATRLQQVFCNLLQNAAKFTPNEGTVTVRSWNTESGGVTVRLSDTGIGIEPEALEKIFDPFEQGSPDLARRYGGLGLGLAISRSLVLAHGGRLTAASPGPGQGATFTVELPHASEGEENNVGGRPS
jgi:two-component system, chemotaxis family, CheB/CheR fusion protein